MTTIVGMVEGNRVFIGGDSAATCSRTNLLTRPKVFHNRGFLFGCCGSPRDLQIVSSSAFNPEPKSIVQSDFDYMVLVVVRHMQSLFKEHGSGRVYDSQNNRFDSGFLIGFGGRLYRMAEDFQLIEMTDRFDSIGSGSDFALGSLFCLKKSRISLGKKIKRALEAAARYDPYTQGPFFISELDETR